MSEIADFLRARIAERRALAEAARPDGFTFNGRQPRATIDHIAANGPEYVIAECDARLALIDEFQRAGASPDTPERRASPSWDGDFGYLQGLARAVHLLAQPFAGHADYKGEEWTP